MYTKLDMYSYNLLYVCCIMYTMYVQEVLSNSHSILLYTNGQDFLDTQNIVCLLCICRKLCVNNEESRRKGETMVLIIDGESEFGTHVNRIICHLICLRHLMRSRAVTNLILFIRKDQFFFMRARHALSYQLIQTERKEARLEF